ncbi:MAG: hypothetical protein A2Z27_02335 [candidate division Zixibacteria bacterium RBG_16_50_21]|nr:MAG: hypothetical protein A2Z27_02335 [candidate division Zixibacteria bacterium RBG_16_50_21]
MQKLVTNFYTPPENVQNGLVRVEGEEAKHLTKVLRHKKGDTISVVDGCGVKYKVVLETLRRDYIEGSILNQVRRENETVANVTLACGISTGTKMDLIIEKCTELGVRGIIPVLTEQTVVEFKDQAKVRAKLSRWNKVAIAAMKQSLRCFLPKIEAPISLSELTQRTVEFEKSLMANLEGGAKPVKEALTAEEPVREILLLVGPESGFTQDEIDLSCSRGFVPVRLGPRRLRTETACVVFCSLVLGYLGELE